MNIDTYLENLKEDYLKIEPSPRFTREGWQELKEEFTRLEVNKSNLYRLRPIIMAALAIFILSGTFAGLAQASQGALPGEPLYPVKRFSENIISTTTGNNLSKADHRAKEIVDLTKKSSEDKEYLDHAVEEYRTEVSNIDKSGSISTEAQNMLEDHERQFEEVKEDTSGSDSDSSGPGSGQEIDEAIEISRSGRDGGDNTGEEDQEENKEEEESEEDRSGSNSGEN